MSVYSWFGKEPEVSEVWVSGLELIWREVVWDETYGTLKELKI